MTNSLSRRIGCSGLDEGCCFVRRCVSENASLISDVCVEIWRQ